MTYASCQGLTLHNRVRLDLVLPPHAAPPVRGRLTGHELRAAARRARQLPGRRGQVCFASNTNLELWTEEVEQGVIDNMIVFQKPFLGAARTELESQLQRAVKVSAEGKHVKCKMDLERCLFWDPGNRAAPRGVRACG